MRVESRVTSPYGLVPRLEKQGSARGGVTRGSMTQGGVTFRTKDTTPYPSPQEGA